MSRRGQPSPSPDVLARDRAEALRLLAGLSRFRFPTDVPHGRREGSSSDRDFCVPSPLAGEGQGGGSPHAPAPVSSPTAWPSPETLTLLDRYVELLLAWQARMNLVGPATLAHVWTRHIADSLQLLAYAPAAKVWADLGSGAGFPGLVIACALKDQPQATVHLVESNSRKAAFLREVARPLALPAEVHPQRIEDVTPRLAGAVEVVTARALAPLPQLLAYAWPLLQKGAQGLFVKGQDVGAELTEATKSWNIRVEQYPSVTDPRGRILRIQPN